MERVCCMCGDVGFSDKLFRCRHCHNRFQHSNYYSESAEPTETCDWCRSDDLKLTRHGGSSSSSKKPSNSSVGYENGFTNRSEYSSGGGIKHNNNRQDQVAKSVAGAGGGVPSPRTATRRYKLLKDVMC
ncbi:unnamed protein product [Arabis nemorensis]|uniref:PHD-type zinc finger plants domain-containing protein n=1 Tax=Arabis nemorensis TaxID=586526 RepID=A0A565AL62_9BRAS|nr:unnamed protein product [Arabis nemorensis]